MKTWFLFMLLTGCFMCTTNAQSFSEWFKQKKTQKKYLLAQIAALETYLKAVEKGYDIANSGLSAISMLKDGDFLQHAAYFRSLEMVSAKVKNYSKVLAIAEMEDRSEVVREVLSDSNDQNVYLNTRELASLRKILENTADAAIHDLEELELLVIDGKLKMTDDERIRRIDGLYLEVKRKLRGVLQLAKNVRSMIASRAKRRKDLSGLKQLYGK